jgi:hypothetical protein
MVTGSAGACVASTGAAVGWTLAGSVAAGAGAWVGVAAGAQAASVIVANTNKETNRLIDRFIVYSPLSDL